MHRQEKWQALLAPILQNTPFELVGVECVGGGKHTVVRVFIDKINGGITIDEIAHLSREMSMVLDVEEAVRGAYTLEVSSPGLERPLFLPAHFKQQIGQQVKVKVRHAINNRQNFKGILLHAGEEDIQLEVEGEKFTFLYEDMEKARVIPEIHIGARSKVKRQDDE